MTEPSWPAASVVMRPLADLAPSARNARLHSDAQIDQIAASIREWGWTNPVLVDEAGTIIAGHGRVLAAERLGIAEVPVMTAVGWTPDQVAAYRIADNKLSENAGWDRQLLGAELQELAGGFDFSLLGFSEDELAALAGGGPVTVREVPTSQVDDRFWVSVRGPLARQAEVLDRLRMAEIDGIDVDVGVISLMP